MNETEYRVEQYRSPEEFQAGLTELASAGWKLHSWAVGQVAWAIAVFVANPQK